MGSASAAATNRFELGVERIDESEVPSNSTEPLEARAVKSDLRAGQRTMGTHMSGPIVEEVLRFENLPPGSAGARHPVVRWSDGSEDAPMTWYADEILSPVDHVGRP